jgi:transposase-like protein
MTNPLVIESGKDPEPKPESFKSWKDKPDQNIKPKKKAGRKKGAPAIRPTKKVMLTEKEVKQLEANKSLVKEKEQIIKNQEQYIRRKLDLPPDEPVPKNLIRGGAKFDMDLMQRFCVDYSQHTQVTRAAKAVGVTPNLIYKTIKSNPIFAEMVNDAKMIYRDKIAEAVYIRAVEGVDEPIIGGMGRDQIVTYKKVYSDRLLELEAKRVDHGYRERGGVEINTGGGVLVVNAGNLDEKSWIEKYGTVEQESLD